MMLLLVLVLSLAHASARVTNGSVTISAPSHDQSQSQTVVPGTEQGQQNIVIKRYRRSCDSEMSGIRSQLAALETRVDKQHKLIEKQQELIGKRQELIGGSVYVRWGGRACADSAETLYSGVIGGSFYNHKGAAANALCLPFNPVYEYDGHRLSAAGRAYLFGAEYEVSPEPRHDQDAVCSVCVSPRSHTVMIPATNTCHPGWTVEYTGYIMAGYYDHPAATEYICMDASQDARVGSHADHNGKVFYYTVGKCGSLPCPPYEDNKIITCVVCSK